MLGTVTEALEQRLILALVGSVEGNSVLDLGCGDGLLTATLATHGARVIGIDIDRSALHAAVARLDTLRAGSVRFVEGRIECLPFPAEAFDVVTAVTVLCLVSDRAAAVREAARVLRPGGRLIRGSVYYPPIGILARALAPLDWWLGSGTTIGAAFIAVAATKRAHVVTIRTEPSRTRPGRLPEAGSAP